MNEAVLRKIAAQLERIAKALEKQAGIEPPEEPKSAYEPEQEMPEVEVSENVFHQK